MDVSSGKAQFMKVNSKLVSPKYPSLGLIAMIPFFTLEVRLKVAKLYPLNKLLISDVTARVKDTLAFLLTM